jgi:AcrR family transcriptional regulator
VKIKLISKGNIMEDNAIMTEEKILKAAQHIFLIYGYHGTTMRQIAVLAGVNQSAIHYYFRSKEKLYARVVFWVVDNILKHDNDLNKEILTKQTWFLYTEFYNNQVLFEKSVKELFSKDWALIFNNIIEQSFVKYPNRQEVDSNTVC